MSAIKSCEREGDENMCMDGENMATGQFLFFMSCFAKIVVQRCLKRKFKLTSEKVLESLLRASGDFFFFCL